MLRLNSILDVLFTRYRWVVHVAFWLFVLGFYGIFFGRANSNYLQTLFFVGLLMPVTIAATYFLNYTLVPNYLMKERYGFFLLYFLYVLVGSLFLEMMVAMLTFIVMAKVNIHDMSPASIDLFLILTSLLLVIFLTMAIKMVLHWRKSKEDYQQLMRDKVETELKFLKTQLNPHFLFNTLNNLYYLSTEKSDLAPKAILALSEILDYVLHSGRTIFIPLSKELKQAENFISLESLRYDDRIEITKDFSGDIDKFLIPPMTLITLIENAFKHGVMPIGGRTWISMSIREENGVLEVNIKNSYQNAHSGKGIGLQNLRSQLHHLYGADYSLNTREQESQYEVSLIIRSK